MNLISSLIFKKLKI